MRSVLEPQNPQNRRVDKKRRVGCLIFCWISKFQRQHSNGAMFHHAGKIITTVHRRERSPQMMVYLIQV